jgi:penicillin amidase
LFNMMAAYNWRQFREGMEYYYSPGLHVVYADRDGNLGYQTLVHVPVTRRTPRMALEGWTGDDEVLGRIPLDEMPNMFNPSSHFVSHANNLPVGSWYPYDLGISTGGIGHTSRSLRLRELLDNERLFSIESFESAVHRDDVQSAVAGLFPVARRLAAAVNESDRGVLLLLDALKTWDLRFRADQATYPGAMALSGAALLSYRRSGLNARLGGGEGGITHLARLLKQQFPGDSGVPEDAEVRNYLLTWLRAAAQDYERNGGSLAPVNGQSRHLHRMPYQANGPLGLPSLDPALDLVSPPLSCGEVGTIWSQTGNSYTQIVDLSDVDNSRTVLPPGISEDPDSPHHTDQMDLWVRGATHPAPLSRGKVEAITVSRVTLEAGP